MNPKESLVEFSVVMPGHNEAENLKILLPRLYGGLEELGVPFELIFVDNASRDNTGEVIADFQKSMPNLKSVPEPTMGYGRAVLRGLLATSGSYIGIMRSDNQEKSEDLNRMFLAIRSEKVDLYKAIRRSRTDGTKRLVVSFIYNTLFRLMFNLRSHDLGATPKIFTRKFYEVAKLESVDWFIDPEIVIKAERLGFSVKEMVVEYLPRLKGESTVRLKHILEFLKNMIQWRLRIFHGQLLEK